MRRLLLLIAVFTVISSGLYSEVIEKIIIKGNKKATRDTILFYMKSKPQAIYHKTLLREDFKALWKTGFFEHIKIDSEDGESGKVVTITVRENKFISKVNFKTNKKFKEKAINEKLQEKNINLMTYSYFNPVKLKQAEHIITEMLREKGYNDGNVTVDTQNIGETVEITIKVDPKSRTRIGVLAFPGIEKVDVKESLLIKGMKNNKRHGILAAIGGKDVYNKEKIAEDLEEVELRMKSAGYLEAKVGQPAMDMVEKRGLWFFSKKKRMLKISIPIDPGPRYTVGKIKVVGNKIIKTDYLESIIKKYMSKAKHFDVKQRDEARDDIRKLYASLGYAYCNIIPEENLDPIKKVADLTFRIAEHDVVYVGNVDFVGNYYTKDFVIRRQWFLREGDRFNTNLLEDCIRTLKQLGLVTIDEMPEITPDPDDQNKMNIKVKVRELNRQMINFNVGYSGYDGWFVAAGYSTQNFLGRGESLALNLQSGTRARNYSISFTEPYVFNTPMTLGISVFSSQYEYPLMYTRASKGFNIQTSYRFWRYWGASLAYSYEDVDIKDIDDSFNPGGNSYYYYYLTSGQRVISAISPTVYYNTVDSPMFPTSGTKYLFNYRYSGGFLGGSVNLHKFKFEYVKFLPIYKRKHILGFRSVFQYMKNFGKGEIPFYERFYLGGEQTIRGFEIYQIGPRSVTNGRPFGGDKAFYMNLEYRIAFNEQFSFALFYDVGNAYDVGKKVNLNDVFTSTGVEFKVYVPMLNVPFRLIFAYNPRKLYNTDNNFEFKFAIGPSFY